MTTRAEWEREVRTIFGRIATHKEEYVTEVEGTGILILPNVFSPAYFTDSGWFAKAVSNIVGKGKVLEIGTGTGVVAFFCAKNGATMTATDINPDAVRNAELNFKENGDLRGMSLRGYVRTDSAGRAVRFPILEPSFQSWRESR